MARLDGVDLPREKRMEIALTYIYGIGKHHAKEQRKSARPGLVFRPDVRYVVLHEPEPSERDERQTGAEPAIEPFEAHDRTISVEAH